jgi:hypothetical protein
MNRSLRILAGAASTLAAITASTVSAQAQSIAGEYQVEVRGATYYLDRAPVEKSLQDNTSLIVKQEGDRITLEFRSFASAMSTTLFHGRVGNNRFVATWSAAGDVRLITGTVDGKKLRGRLIYPRASAEAGVPGWTEVEFGASQDQSRVNQTSAPTSSAMLRPTGTPPLAATTSAAKSAFEVDVVALTAVEAPIAGHRIEFLARATPASAGASVERIELWINGLVQGSSDGAVLEVEAGPFGAGQLDYDIVAISNDGVRSKPSRQRVLVTAAGNTTISGRLTGSPSMITDLQLVRPDGLTVAKSAIGSGGRYSISGIPAGKYVIFVNDAKREARVSPSPNLEISVDGRSSYTRNFEIR